MNDKNESTPESGGGEVRKFLGNFFASLAQDLVRLVASFAVGTGAGALVCWYYGLPLVLSLIGGILVLGFALALTSDTWFS